MINQNDIERLFIICIYVKGTLAVRRVIGIFSSYGETLDWLNNNKFVVDEDINQMWERYPAAKASSKDEEIACVFPLHLASEGSGNWKR